MHLPQDPEKIFEKAFVEDVAVFVANGNFGKDAELAQPIEPLYAIQAYISSGIKYPQTNGEFEKETPEATYEVITQVLPKLYMNTRKTLTSVSKSCHKFKEEALDGLLFYPKIISSYCENALDALESKESGLVQQLKVLTDTKYDKVTPGEEDNDFNDAKELAIFSLGEMQIQAEKHKQSISDLKQKVTEFKAETDSNRGMAKDLDATYSQKVLVEGNSYESVLDFVGGQLKGMEEKLNTANERYEEAYDQEEAGKDHTRFTYWRNALYKFGGVIWWVKGYFTFKAEDKELADSLKALRETEEAKANIVSCRLSVQALATYLPKLLSQMDDAIKAMGTLAKAFDDQVSDLELVKGQLKKAQGGIDRQAAVRRAITNSSIGGAIAKYKTIKELAEKFHSDIRLFEP